MPFQYDQYRSPYVGTMADLLAHQNDARARAAEISGQAWGGAVANIGQTIAQMPGQIAQQRRVGLQDQVLAGQVADQQAARTGQRAVDTLMQGDQLPAGATGPRQESYTDANGLFDVPKLNQALAKMGVGHMAPDLLKGAEAINASIIQHQALEQKLGEASTLMLGDMADGVSKLAAIGMPLDRAMDFVMQPALATKRITPDRYAQIKGQILALPQEQQKAALDQFMNAAAKLGGGKTLAKDALEVDRYNRPMASNVVPEKPTEASIAMDAAGGNPTAQRAIGMLKPGPKQSIEEEWMARDRRLAVAKNNGKPLTDEQLRATDTASMQAFAQSKADPEVRAAALAQKAIAASLANMQLGMMPTKEQAADIASDVVAHRIAPSQVASLFSTRGKEGLAFKLAVSSEAKKLDPSFNWEEAQSVFDLVKSPGFQNTVRYMDSVLESMPRLLKNAATLGNGNFRTWSQIANAAASQFNDVDLKRLKTDAVLVGDEVAKILAGGGSGSATSDAKLKQGMDVINLSDSVPAMAGALDEIEALLGNRRKSLTRGTYMEGTAAVKPLPTDTAQKRKNPFSG